MGSTLLASKITPMEMPAQVWYASSTISTQTNSYADLDLANGGARASLQKSCHARRKGVAVFLFQDRPHVSSLERLVQGKLKSNTLAMAELSKHRKQATAYNHNKNSIRQ